MKLRIFDNNGKTADRYTVIIDDDVFTLSTDCNMPNGVNMYCCSAKYIDIEKIEKDNKEITHYAVSQTVLNCIIDKMITD